MTAILLAASDDRQASPIGLVVILCLLVALILLIRSMNRHLRRVPPTFPAGEAGPDRRGDVATGAADAAGAADSTVRDRAPSPRPDSPPGGPEDRTAG